MPFDPDFGQTLLVDEDKAALTDQARALLGDPILTADLYDLEQQIQAQVADGLVEDFLSRLTVDEILSDHFIRDLHRHLYGPIWIWGVRHRRRETNIGMAPDLCWRF